jgi:hypothetical protein
MMRAICLTLGLLLGTAATSAADAADATVPEERIIEQ